jgi:ankyrin repeat protein
VVEILLKAGAEVDKQDNGGRTALDYAAPRGDGGVVDILLKAGADTGKRNANGETTLEVASKFQEVGELYSEQNEFGLMDTTK